MGDPIWEEIVMITLSKSIFVLYYTYIFLIININLNIVRVIHTLG